MRCAWAVLTVCALAACSQERRRPEFPVLSGHEPFEGVSPQDAWAVTVPGESRPALAKLLPERPHVRVPLPAGFDGVLPCEDGWQWGMDGSSFVAIHRAPGAEAGLDVVFAVEQSQPMGVAQRKAAVETTEALLKRLPDSARAAVVTFGGEEGERRALQDGGARQPLVSLLKNARATEGSSVAAGLSAAEELLAEGGEGRSRRVVVVASAQAGSRGAKSIASRLASAGVTVSVVALGKGRGLAEVAEAGRGQFTVGADAAAASSQGACAAVGRPGTGPVDAWVVMGSLVQSGVDLSPVVAQFRFLLRAEPSLTGMVKLKVAALKAVKEQVDPANEALGALADEVGSAAREAKELAGVAADVAGAAGQGALADGAEKLAGTAEALAAKVPPVDVNVDADLAVDAGALEEKLGGAVELAGLIPDGGLPAEAGSKAAEVGKRSKDKALGAARAGMRRLVLGGMGIEADPDSWTGWRWMGENRHHARWRLGAETGKVRREAMTGEAPEGELADGTPVRLVLGYLGDGEVDERGLGVAMVCVRARCPGALAFAAMVAEARPPDVHRPAAASGGERTDKLAAEAGFSWTR